MDARAAYRHCEEITWSQARNFAYGIRLLPAAKRQALAAVYAFARRIDDIGDGDLPAAGQAGRAGARPGPSVARTGRRAAAWRARGRRPGAGRAGRRGAPVRRSRWPRSAS